MRKKIILIIAITGIITSALVGCSENTKSEIINTTTSITTTESATQSATEQTVATTRELSTTSKKVNRWNY